MIERTILSNLSFNENYTRRVLPYLKEDYFHNLEEKVVFNLIKSYITEYNSLPVKEALYIELSKKTNLNENNYKTCQGIINDLEPSAVQLDWLVQNTEKFVQDKSLHNAILESIRIIDDKKGAQDRGTIPQLLQDALAVSFDTHIGHDFFDDAEARWEYYHLTETKIEFDLSLFNDITRGGLSRKTLNIILADTGVGKTLFMCHNAAANLYRGYNVLYITNEMAEERIAERIDANLLDVEVDHLATMSKASYQQKMKNLKERTKGKLVIKEYPTSSANAIHFKYLINELALKKKFVPDIIYIDYLNICASSRVRMSSSINSYTYIKSIAEELRSLAVEFNVPIMTATQSNRDAHKNSDISLKNTSESYGVPATADIMFGLVSLEELEARNQLMVIQMKNRYSDPGKLKRFIIGIDRARMKLYDAEPEAQNDLVDDTPIMDKGNFETSFRERSNKFRFDDIT